MGTRIVTDYLGRPKAVRDEDTFPLGRVELGGGKKNITSKAANFTLTSEDSGNVYVIAAADVVATLPSTAPGLIYTFIVSTLSATTGFSASPAAADKIMGGGLTAADNKDIINTAATDAVGDKIVLIGDVAGDGWLVFEKVGTWAREA